MKSIVRLVRAVTVPRSRERRRTRSDTTETQPKHFYSLHQISRLIEAGPNSKGGTIIVSGLA